MGTPFNVVGQRLPMHDAAAKAKGTAQFTDDILLPGMLHGKILRSPLAHARILRIDTSLAEKLPGVKGRGDRQGYTGPPLRDCAQGPGRARPGPGEGALYRR